MSDEGGNQSQSQGYQKQSQPQEPPRPQVVVQSTSQMDFVRAMAASRSYYGPAMITLALYWLLFWIGGVIANVIYLNSAHNAEKISGVSPEGKGCLWLLLITHVILPLVGGCLFLALGGLAAIGSR